MKTTSIPALALALALGTVHCAAPSEGGQPTEAALESARLETAEGPALLGGVGSWKGQGVVHDMSGARIADFDVTLERKMVGTVLRTDGQIAMPGGQRVDFWQEAEGRDPSGFRLTSNRGAGGGRCFSNGMCQTLEVAGTKSFATTLVVDGPTRVRLLTTSLEDGKPVGFTEQRLSKQH